MNGASGGQMMMRPNELLTRIETARLWSFFHKDWLLQARLSLREQLPSDYRVFVESEAVLISPEANDVPPRVTLPDLLVARPASHSQENSLGKFANDTTAATIEVEEPYSIETRYWLTIRRSPGQEIVAVMELLSPSNKGIGNRLDRQKHLRKREEYLNASVNLLEIDALVEGERDLPPSVSQLKGYQRSVWSVTYQDGRRRFQGWGWNLPDPLPTIQWQIDSGHSVRVDLGKTLADAAAFNDWESMVG